jgi:hypothetical protein
MRESFFKYQEGMRRRCLKKINSFEGHDETTSGMNSDV